MAWQRQRIMEWDSLQQAKLPKALTPLLLHAFSAAANRYTQRIRIMRCICVAYPAFASASLRCSRRASLSRTGCLLAFFLLLEKETETRTPSRFAAFDVFSFYFSSAKLLDRASASYAVVFFFSVQPLVGHHVSYSFCVCAVPWQGAS